MSDAKPYTMDRLDAVLSEWEQGGKPRFVSADLRATVRALDAAQADNAALRARVAELEAMAKARADEDAEADRILAEALPADSFTRYVSKLEATERERDEWKAKAEDLMVERDHWQLSDACRKKGRDEAGALADTNFKMYCAARGSATEAAALAERLREALRENLRRVEAALTQASILNVSYSVRDSLLVAERSMGTALSTPVAPWLRERDRALAMKVAEAVRGACAEFVGSHRGAIIPLRVGLKLAAIVDEVVP